MKKIIMITACIAAITISAFAQKLTAAKVPAAVKTAFEKKYKGATASWEKEDGKYEANFKEHTVDMSATFEANGTFTEAEMDIKITALPPAVLSYIKEHYKGKAIKEAAKISNADGSINYEAQVNGKDVIFDESGKFLKEIKD